MVQYATTPSGNGELADDRLVLGPLGGGADDWPRLMAAAAEMAYVGPIVLLPGTYYCLSKRAVPNGMVLIGNPGVHIITDLTQNAPGGAEDACPFYNAGGTGAGTAATLTADADAGDTVVTVDSTTSITVDDRINFRYSSIRRTARRVISKTSTTITLDRPLPAPFPSGSTVAVVTTTRDIKIHGNGMQVSGTGDRIVEFISAWDCLVEDVRGSGDWAFFAFGYDVGSRDSHFLRCTLDGEGVTGAGYALEYADNCSIVDCTSRNCTGQGIILTGANNCTVIGGDHSCHVSDGLTFTVNHDSDTWGCRGNKVIGGAYNKNVYGIRLLNGSADNDIIGAETSSNQIGIFMSTGTTGAPSQRTSVLGGRARENTSAAIFTDNAGKGHKVVGHHAEDNGASTGNVYVASATGAELDISDCVITDSGVTPALRGLILASGSGAAVRVKSVHATSTRSSGYSVFCEVAGGARLTVDGQTHFARSGADLSIGIYVSNGKARVNGYRQPGGSDGIYATGASSSIRVGDGVDVNSCTTPFTATASGTLNRGTFTANGVTGVDVAFKDTNSSDRMFITRKTSGGTPGHVTTGAAIVNEAVTGFYGFRPVSQALDTSVYEYEIRGG